MRGVFAKKDISKGSSLVFVPYDALIERDMMFNTPLGEQMKEHDLYNGHGTLWFPSVTMLAVFYLQ
jgi:hypothetical protein